MSCQPTEGQGRRQSDSEATSTEEAPARNSFDTEATLRGDKDDSFSTSSTIQPMDTSSTTATEQKPSEETSPLPKKTVPSYSPLAFANYPPLWTPNKDGSSSTAKANREAGPSEATRGRTQSGFSAATLSSVMATKSKDDGKGKQFSESDPSNRHEYLQQPDKPYTRPQLNIFGREIGGLRKRPPGLGLGRKKGK